MKNFIVTLTAECTKKIKIDAPSAEAALRAVEKQLSDPAVLTFTEDDILDLDVDLDLDEEADCAGPASGQEENDPILCLIRAIRAADCPDAELVRAVRTALDLREGLRRS